MASLRRLMIVAAGFALGVGVAAGTSRPLSIVLDRATSGLPVF